MLLNLISLYIQSNNSIRTFAKSFSLPYFVRFTKYSYSNAYQDKTWDLFKQKYMNSSKIAITDVNCDMQPGLCLSPYSVKKYPAFAFLNREIPNFFTMPSTLDELENHIEAHFKPNFLCPLKIFPDELIFYPAIIIQSPNTIADICPSIIKLVGNNTDHFRKLYYQQSNYDNIQVETGMSTYRYAGTNSKAEMNNFILDSLIDQLDYTPFKIVKNTRRRLVLFISDIGDDVYEFEDGILPMAEKLVASMINSTNFTQLFGKQRKVLKSELPAMVMFSRDKTKWMLIPSINLKKAQIVDILTDYLADAYDSQMIYRTNYFGGDIIKSINTKVFLYVLTALLLVTFVLSLFFAKSNSVDESEEAFLKSNVLKKDVL